jgi:hypothetical protein
MSQYILPWACQFFDAECEVNKDQTGYVKLCSTSVLCLDNWPVSMNTTTKCSEVGFMPGLLPVVMPIVVMNKMILTG